MYNAVAVNDDVADDEGAGGDEDFHRSGFGCPEEIGELALVVLTQYFKALTSAKGPAKKASKSARMASSPLTGPSGGGDRTLFCVVLHDGSDITGADDFAASRRVQIRSDESSSDAASGQTLQSVHEVPSGTLPRCPGYRNRSQCHPHFAKSLRLRGIAVTR